MTTTTSTLEEEVDSELKINSEDTKLDALFDQQTG
jgi:hypothetical protein